MRFLIPVTGLLSVMLNLVLAGHAIRIHISGPLPEPYLPVLAFSGPLEMTPFSDTILGAQTFNPNDVVTYVNKEREKAGRKPLRISPLLTRAAQMRADTIMKHENFSHYDPYENIILATVMPAVGYRHAYATENIGMGGTSGADFVYGFMHSTAHRNNILDPTLVDTGVGLSTGPYGTYYVNVAVQLFAVPGGKEEALGYTEEEAGYYRVRLGYLKNELNPLTWTIGKIMEPDLFSDERYNFLTEQLQTVATVYGLMSEEKPLTAREVAMIREFNTSL